MDELEEGQERTEFDMEKFMKVFNDREPEIEIPEEVFADEDGDIEWEEPEI
jgi:hypothetical protein